MQGLSNRANGLNQRALPNSRDRRVAASTAIISAARIPAFSSSCSPAMVFPPGEVTLSLSSAGCLFCLMIIATAPSIVWVVSIRACALGSPILTPPSARASIIRNMYAGPLPLEPVTASINFSWTSRTCPQAPRIPSIDSLTSGESCPFSPSSYWNRYWKRSLQRRRRLTCSAPGRRKRGPE